MTIVNEAPTKIPIPSTDTALSCFPADQFYSWTDSPDEADLNIKGKLPTSILARNMAIHCDSSTGRPILAEIIEV